jgi:ribosome-binding protein aMBF1 (putative translation factor)
MQAMKQANANLEDLNKRGTDAVGENALEFLDTLLTPEEKTESDLRVALIGEIITARKEQGISQKKLEELSGIKQPVIARMENGTTIPNLNTVLRILAPLGKTLYVGDLK